MVSQLAYLRSTGTAVDCDTLSLRVISKSSPSHGAPFTGCTSNQAIAYVELISPTAPELSKPDHRHDGPSSNPRVISALSFAKSHIDTYRALPAESPDPDLTVPQLAVEVAMVQMAIAMAPAIDPETGGDLHVQTNPAYATSTQKTIANGVRLKQLFDSFLSIAPNEESHTPHTHGEGKKSAKVTLCVKIPTNYPSMLAARELKKKYGIRCLATVGVSFPQVRLAREVGECEYVAVYVNELGVHFDEERKKLVSRRKAAGVAEDGTEDLVQAMEVVRDGQEWLIRKGGETKMMPASLTSTNECLQLAGVTHITISPALLTGLANQVYSAETAQKSYLLAQPALSEGKNNSRADDEARSYLDNEAAFEQDFAKARGGRAREMFDEAVRIFAGVQDKLEELVAGDYR